MTEITAFPLKGQKQISELFQYFSAHKSQKNRDLLSYSSIVYGLLTRLRQLENYG